MKDIIDSHYKPDLEIADRYINFSSELLRLSLLAITGIGALILANFKEDSGFHLTLGNKYCFLISILLFAAAAAFSLFHRFYASDVISYHIAYLRSGDEKEKEGRTDCLKKSETYLIWTERFFGVAVIAFVVSIFVFLLWR